MAPKWCEIKKEKRGEKRGDTGRGMPRGRAVGVGGDGQPEGRRGEKETEEKTGRWFRERERGVMVGIAEWPKLPAAVVIKSK